MTETGVRLCLPLFGRGVRVEGAAGEGLDEFLVRELGLPPGYVRERVQTLFLNGKAIDDPARARLARGATVALSAAMPGLAGAVLRRGGFYADLRRQISAGATSAGGGPAERIGVTVKLFNLVAREIGPGLLARGVWLEGAGLRDFLMRQGREFWASCRRVEVDGRAAEGASAAAGIPEAGWVRLEVHCG
jgi:hypothetical protein